MRKQDGFTLIEFIVVMAIGVVLATGSFLTYSNYKERKDLEFAVDEVFSVVKSAQDRSVVQEGGSGWGVRFNSSSTGVDGYELFKGSTYSSSTVETGKGFRRSVKFSEPSGGRTYDMIFDSRTGKLNERKIITLTHKNENQQAGDVIVNSLGKSTRRMMSNIVGYWHFDEGTGTSTLDASGEGNTGELMNGVSWLSGNDCKAGGCLDFDGTDDYVEVGSLNNSSDLTVEAWVKFDSLDNNWLLNKRDNVDDNQWQLIHYDGALRAQVFDGTTGSVGGVNYGDINTDQWYHLAFTTNGISGGYINLYVDGEQVDSSSLSGDMKIGERELIIGSRGWLKSEGLHDGKIDEARIYNTALSSSTIKDHYDDLK